MSQPRPIAHRPAHSDHSPIQPGDGEPGGSGLRWGTRQARVMPCYRQGGGLSANGGDVAGGVKQRVILLAAHERCAVVIEVDAVQLPGERANNFTTGQGHVLVREEHHPADDLAVFVVQTGASDVVVFSALVRGDDEIKHGPFLSDAPANRGGVVRRPNA